jgi:hypothetical protein
MAEHSAGPWTLHRFKDTECGGGEDWFRLSADSTLFVTIAACSDGYVPNQNEANAYLLWAAPDLLAALKSLHVLVEASTRCDPSPGTMKAIEAAKAAIAKATGQGPTF